MKQFLVIILTLVLSLPSYASPFAMFEQNSATSNSSIANSDATISPAKDSASTISSDPQHFHYHMMESDKAGTQASQNHDCCDGSEAKTHHSGMDCSEECGDCSHGCGGACLALLPENSKGHVSQTEQTLLAAMQLPAAPYQNPLIPPIIS